MTAPGDGHAADEHATPPCPHFGVCGGCQLQHLAYSAQLDRKAARLREVLAPLVPALPEIQLHPSPPLAYRNRIRLTLREVDGRLRAGYLGIAAQENSLGGPLIEQSEITGDQGSPGAEIAFVPITQCPIAAPLLWRTAESFLALANDLRWLRTTALTPDQLELFATADESKLQFTLYLRTAHKNPPSRLVADFTALCESLRAAIPELAGAGIALLPLPSRSRRIEQPRPGPAWGSPGFNYSVPLATANNEERTTENVSLTYWVPRGAFFQVNRFLLPELVSLVINRAASSQNALLAWDLYAGVGLFSRALARTFVAVTAVEIGEPAATALAQTKLPNLRAVKATTLDFLQAAVLQRDCPSFVVLDPPRTGLGDEVCSLLARIAVPAIAYVSCSPQALAGDLAILVASGYVIAELHFFDLFPQTSHIETVAILTRSHETA
jgi:23S rRNA (uracil1939-C5)-methyltransferase